MAATAPFLQVLSGQRHDPPPVWMMRQAGRYLAEYRELRAAKGGFLDMAYDPATAAEITLQPIRRFAMDAAILFSDILIVPHALGQNLSFTAGEGPRLRPPLTHGWIDGLRPDASRLATIHETCRILARVLPPHVPLIGFAGAPFTVATYMVAGEGTRDQAPARLLAHQDPGAFQELLSRIEATTLDYLAGQVEAGAKALMLFDSWAGALSAPEYARWVVAPIARLVEALRARCPGTPIIAFPRGSGEKYPAFAREARPDCLALDEHVDARWAHRHLPPGLPVQGNLDQLALQAGGEGLDRAVDDVLDAFRERPHIFNLGHGIGQFTPVEHVHQMLRKVRHG